MISEEEARKKVLANIGIRPSRSVLLWQALSCFAAEDYFSLLPLPSFDNSAMDGYAVVASACGVGKQLRVIGEQPAALDRQLRVSAGEAARIFTGAPTTIALLASQGFTQVSGGGEVDAAIISTGDELVGAGEEIKPGQIYESNSFLLQALLQRCNAAVKSVRHCKDDAESLRKTLEEAIKYSVLIISGGVSVGEHDLVQPTLRSLGAKIDIWRVAIKPGKPFLFGHAGDCAVFGLPGNPVSAFVTFLRFVRPAILKMMGATNLDLPKVPAKLPVDLRNESDRPHYVRGRFENGTFAPVGRQESHALFGLSQSNALLRREVGEARTGGETVDVQTFD